RTAVKIPFAGPRITQKAEHVLRGPPLPTPVWRFTIMICRKLFWTGAVVLAGLVLAKTTALGSLFQVVWTDARSGLERAVPPEVQLKQLRVEIDKVDQDI